MSENPRSLANRYRIAVATRQPFMVTQDEWNRIKAAGQPWVPTPPNSLYGVPVVILLAPSPDADEVGS